jgi:hypothetical protein
MIYAKGRRGTALGLIEERHSSMILPGFDGSAPLAQIFQTRRRKPFTHKADISVVTS